MQSLPINGESTFLYPSINVFAMRLNIGFEVSRFDEQGAEGFAYLGESSIGNGVSRHDDVSVFAVDERDQPCEILVNPSFRQISDDAFAYLFAYAHAHFNALGGHELEYEKRVRVRLTFAINVAETCVLFKSVGSLHYAEMTALPFLLRRESTFLPPLVDIL